MYVLKRKGTRVGKTTFTSYDAARNFARRAVRQEIGPAVRYKAGHRSKWFDKDCPNITRYGFTISKR